MFPRQLLPSRGICGNRKYIKGQRKIIVIKVGRKSEGQGDIKKERDVGRE